MLGLSDKDIKTCYDIIVRVKKSSSDMKYMKKIHHLVNPERLQFFIQILCPCLNYC